jgi:hypothetical protein
MTMVRPFSQDYRYVEPNITYSVLETLIATFMDKYELKYDDIVKVLNERRLNNAPLTTQPNRTVVWKQK